MNRKTLTLLNTSIVTSYGKYSYEPVSLAHARKLVREYQANGRAVRSAIGHQSTAELLTSLLKFPVRKNHRKFKHAVSNVALVFKLNERVAEGKVLTRKELEAIGYEFGLLIRTA